MPVVTPLAPFAGPRPGDPVHHDINSDHNHNHNHTHDRNCSPSVRALLEHARQGLLDAEYATHPVERYAQAHLAALRAAAAVLAARARSTRRARPASVWTLLTPAAPELAEWSAFFATASATRAAAEAGVHRLVTSRDADDMVRQAGQFLVIAQRSATRILQ